ncbi:MAG: hypothetical protein ACTSRK_20920 [Promethearchaeota archaeon]
MCNNPVFQEYLIDDNRVQTFYDVYAAEGKKYNYKDAFYVMAGSGSNNRIKLFGLSDIANPREFFGIKANFHTMSKQAYKQSDKLYTTGVVNTFYYLKFKPEDAEKRKALKAKLDPDELVNSYRFVKAKMKFWRVNLLFWVAKFLYTVA